jgi:hypothetical protein
VSTLSCATVDDNGGGNFFVDATVVALRPFDAGLEDSFDREPGFRLLRDGDMLFSLSNVLLRIHEHLPHVIVSEEDSLRSCCSLCPTPSFRYVYILFIEHLRGNLRGLSAFGFRCLFVVVFVELSVI